MLRRCLVLNLIASSLLAATAQAQSGPGTIYSRLFGSHGQRPCLQEVVRDPAESRVASEECAILRRELSAESAVTGDRWFSSGCHRNAALSVTQCQPTP
jgi:hypothetical protein